MTNLDSILKSRDVTLPANVRHVWIWELDYKESWESKKWCFWTVVSEKTLESPLDCKEIHPVHPQGNQSWIFIGRTNAETAILWPPDGKNWLLGKDPDGGKDWRQKKRATEYEMFGWHRQFNGQTLGDSEGQGSLACCSPWGYEESDMMKQLSTHTLHICPFYCYTKLSF